MIKEKKKLRQKRKEKKRYKTKERISTKEKKKSKKGSSSNTDEERNRMTRNREEKDRKIKGLFGHEVQKLLFKKMWKL